MWTVGVAWGQQPGRHLRASVRVLQSQEAGGAVQEVKRQMEPDLQGILVQEPKGQRTKETEAPGP
jgi:hypothetical protein